MPTEIVLSSEQIAICEWFRTGRANGVESQHLVVKAFAGTGKSFTIRHGVKQAPESNIWIAAFGKNIQLDMQRLMGPFPNGVIKTIHAVGLSCIGKFRSGIKVAFTSDRADALALQACGKAAPDAVVRLVSKLHTKGREIAPHASKMGDLAAIQITFECEPDEQWERAGFGAAYVEQKALEAMELAADLKNGDTIDGSDMIFLPVRNGWMTKQFDMVVVDEAQDMTVAQLEIAQGVLKSSGRICIVGDSNQAIFGFRGADSGSLDRLKGELQAAELGLTVTRRCGRAIVELAQAYVPTYVAHESCSDGIISRVSMENLTASAMPSDFILSRVNAPLVSIAMKLLRAGKRTKVAGRDIGKGLTALVRKLRARTVPELLAKIEAWAGREVQKHQRALEAATNGRKTALKAKIEAIHDQADMLSSLADGAKNVDEIMARVESLFTDDGLGAAGVITCSSVHRAKGMEADRVFILAETLRDGNQEERNICYVAITRAKHELVWVGKEAA